MTKDKALKLALEALEMFCEHGAILCPIETRDAIKQALAAPESEPVQATMKLESSGPGHGPAPKQKLSVRHVSLIDEGKTSAQPAVPDAFGTREGEHPQYIQGWNDCRAEMLKGMK